MKPIFHQKIGAIQLNIPLAYKAFHFANLHPRYNDLITYSNGPYQQQLVTFIHLPKSLLLQEERETLTS